MVVFPDFNLIAGNHDVTQHIKNNLISLSLSDKDGYESDELTFTVSDIYIRPKLGDELNLKLGTVGNLHDYGVFMVHSTNIDYMERTTEVRATAVNFAGKLKERKSRQWEKLSLADISARIASEQNLSIVSDDEANIMIASRAQNNASDLVFLRTLANDYGFTCILKNNTIYITKKGKTPKDGYTYEVSQNECFSLQINRAAKNEYNSVEISWQNFDKAEMISVKSGEGDPVYNIEDIRPQNENEAQCIADAKLKALQQGTVSGSLTIIGGKLIKSGGLMNLTGIENDSGVYTVNSVTHSMSTGDFITTIEFTAE